HRARSRIEESSTIPGEPQLVDPARLVDGDVLSPGVVVRLHEFDQVDVDVDHEQFAMLLNAAWNWRSASPRG
ncbi:hypothetical protein O4158_00005, partial [Gordonia amicalis]|uniref:hypothetical protein n=1 Tax=Gordonia amicalis TaxID=89053 RepID=UPI0022B4701C